MIHNKHVTRAFAQKTVLIMRSPSAMDEVPAPLKGHGQGLKWTSGSPNIFQAKSLRYSKQFVLWGLFGVF